MVAARARAPADGRRRVPRARASAASAAATSTCPAAASSAGTSIREYASHAASTLRRRCPGDHHRPVPACCSEAGLLTEAGHARRRTTSRLPAAGRGDPLAGRQRAVRRGRPGAAHPGQRGRPAGQPVLPRPVPGASPATLAGLRAKEHTAQVPPADRQEREQEFSEAALPVLYCSPTMELGVDINAPERRRRCATSRRPRRTTRSAPAAPDGPGSPPWSSPTAPPATPTTSTTSAVPTEMVGGSVAPPRLDLANEDLIRSHVQAIWLAETGQDLRGSLTELLDVARRQPQPGTAARGTRAAHRPGGGAARRRRGPRPCSPELPASLATGTLVAGRAGSRRDRPGAAARSTTPADRWRDLYRLALQEFHAQSARSVDVSVPHKEREHRRPARPRRPDPAEPAEQRGLRRLPDRLLLLPLLRLRGVPARLLVPAAAARRLHPRPDRPPRGRLHPAAPVHRHQRVRPRRGDLPRGRPLPGRQRGRCRQPSRARTARSPPPPAAAATAATCTPRRSASTCASSCGAAAARHHPGLLRLTTVRTARRDRISSDEEERRRAGFELQTSYRFAQHGGKPGRLDATAAGEDGAACSASPTATPRRSGSPTSAARRRAEPRRPRLHDRRDHRPVAEGERARGRGRAGRGRPGGSAAASSASSGSSPTSRTAATSS